MGHELALTRKPVTDVVANIWSHSLEVNHYFRVEDPERGLLSNVVRDPHTGHLYKTTQHNDYAELS